MLWLDTVDGLVNTTQIAVIRVNTSTLYVEVRAGGATWRVKNYSTLADATAARDELVARLGATFTAI